MDEVRVLLEGAEAFGGLDPGAFPELVLFEEEARVRGVGLERALVGLSGFGGFALDVEVGDAEVAPGDRVGGVEQDALFPEAYGFVVTSAIVEEVAEVVGGAGFIGVGADGGLEDIDFLEAGGEAVVGWEACGAFEEFEGLLGVVLLEFEPAERVGNEWCGAEVGGGQGRFSGWDTSTATRFWFHRVAGN